MTDYLKNPDITTDLMEAQRSFIVDVGVEIQLENKILYCYIIDNDDDFCINENDSYLFISNFILNKNDYFKFIKI